jgi:hypothetical protein
MGYLFIILRSYITAISFGILWLLGRHLCYHFSLEYNPFIYNFKCDYIKLLWFNFTAFDNCSLILQMLTSIFEYLFIFASLFKIGSSYIAQAGYDPPSSISPVLELQICATTPKSCDDLLKKWFLSRQHSVLFWGKQHHKSLRSAATEANFAPQLAWTS